MGKIRTLQTNFTSGVLDESMRGRIDMQVYKNGIKTGRNIRLRPQGGAIRRAGSTAVVKHDYVCQVETFEFSDTEAYVFFFRTGYVDIFDRTTRTLVQTLSGGWTSDMVTNGEIATLQIYDKMIVGHKDLQPVVITRTGLSTFTIGALLWMTDAVGSRVYQPYHKYARSDFVMTPGAASGLTTMLCNASFWTASMVGQVFWIEGTQFVVNSLASSTVANVNIYGTIPTGIATTANWAEPAFSTWRGWPRCFGLHDQRLWIGGSRDAPNILFGSVAGVPLNFDTSGGSSYSAIVYGIFSEKVVEIRAIQSFTHLQVFTNLAEFYVAQNGTLTPSNFSMKTASSYGCGYIRPRRFDQTSIFLTKRSAALREMTYDDVRASYAVDSLSLMAKALIPSPVDLDVQIEGNSDEQEARAYVLNSDGTIGVLSKVKKENVSGWTQWTTQGAYKKICVVGDELWLHVERTVNGVTARYIEVSDLNAALDFSASLSGAASKTWGPFNMHKGQEVHVVSGNLYFGTRTVDATTGMITVPVEVTTVQIGFLFVPYIEPLSQEVQMPDGVTMGEFKRYVSMTAILADTLSCKIKNRVLPATLPNEDPSAEPTPFTGLFQAWLLGWDKTATPSISAPEPLPFNVNGLVYEVET